MGNNSTFLTLITSFCLSAIAYQGAQPREVPVQKMEFEERVIEGRVEFLEFEDYVITAGGSDEVDDGDTKGIDWDQNYAFWCATHPDECDDAVVDGGEEQGGYEC